jgi:hypothetical protein
MALATMPWSEGNPAYRKEEGSMFEFTPASWEVERDSAMYCRRISFYNLHMLLPKMTQTQQ